MRKFFIYIAALTISSAVVFLLVFSLGRSPSLEQEMARRAYRQRGDQALSISALKSAEVEESEVIEELPPPEVVSLTENVTVARSPLEEGGVVLLLDPELLFSGSGGNVPPHADFRRGLKSFFSKMPSSFRIGLRALAGEEEGDCGSTVELQPLGAWPPGELAAAGQGEARGPRNIARAMEDAAADLGGVEGEQAIIIVTRGEERCGGAPCQTAAILQETPRPARIFVVVLRRIESYEAFEPLAPPLWQARMECLAERGNGRIFQVSTALGLESALLRIVASLQPNVTVRAFHSAEREITGTNVEDRNAWGAVMTPRGSPEAEGASSASFPATLTLSPGEYDLRMWYRGQERLVKGLSIPSGEAVEIQASFNAGEFYLQPKDASGQELVGDTTDLNCFWGAEVFQEENLTHDYGASCTFPAYFVLEPGTYTVRTWKGTSDVWLENVEVKEGETAVKTAVFADEND